MCTHIHFEKATLWRVGFAWTYRTLPQLFTFPRRVPVQDWSRRDSALKAHSTHTPVTPAQPPRLPSSPLPPRSTRLPAPPALTQTRQENSRRRSPGANAVTYQQDGAKAAEASPHSLPHRHTPGLGGGPAVPWPRLWARYSHIQARAAARLGHQPAAGSPPAAAARPPRPPGGTSLRRQREPRGASLLPPGRPTSPLPPRRGRRRGREGKRNRRAGSASALPRRGPAERRLPGRRGSEG